MEKHMQHELEALHKTLEEIEKAFYLVAAHDSELQAYGLERLARWFDLGELLPILGSFPVQLASCLRIIEIFDRGRHEKLVNLLTETKLEDLITRFSVKLRIAQNERRRISLLPSMFRVLNLVTKAKITSDLFKSEDMSMEGALSAIARIKSSLAIIGNDLNERLDNDDEIFKPSNLDVLRITKEIDSAIYSVRESVNLSSSEQAKLVEYLEEAKSELTKKSPAWRKIIGALVISSALLGGVAVAPQAAENIDKALSYILGTSILSDKGGKLNLPKQLENPNEPDSGPEVYSI